MQVLGDWDEWWGQVGDFSCLAGQPPNSDKWVWVTQGPYLSPGLGFFRAPCFQVAQAHEVCGGLERPRHTSQKGAVLGDTGSPCLAPEERSGRAFAVLTWRNKS